MAKKNKRNFDGMVYSTDPDFTYESETEEQETLAPQQQKLRIRLETKQRGGKKATLVSNFIGTQADLEILAKKLKNHCGTGGSVIDFEILIQGDQVQKVKAYLQLEGYKTNNI